MVGSCAGVVRTTVQTTLRMAGKCWRTTERRVAHKYGRRLWRRSRKLASVAMPRSKQRIRDERPKRASRASIMGQSVAASRALPAQGKAFAVDDQTEAQLLAVGPMVARVTALGFGIVWQAAFEIGTGQVVEEQVVAKGEQVTSLFGQVFFDGCLMWLDQAEAA